MTKLIKLALLTIVLATQLVQAAYESDAPVDFSLQRLHGDPVSLSDYRQQWVVVNYWATWCVPCREEIPDLSALHEARDDVTVLGLAFEDTEIETFDAFLEEFEPSYPILLVDVYAPPEPFGAPKALPTTVILDPEGYPVKTYLGPVTRENIETFIDSQ